ARRWNGVAFVEELPSDASFTGIAPGAVPEALAVAVDQTRHPFVAWQDATLGHPEIGVRGSLFTVAQKYFVNDASVAGDVITTAAGTDPVAHLGGNDGLTTGRPRASVASILDSYDLGAGDVILVDAGTYASGFTLTASDQGVLIQGSPGAPTIIDAPVVIDHAARVTLQNLTLRGGLTLRGATEVTLNGCTVEGPGLTLDGGRDIQIVHSVIDAIGTGLTLTGGV